MNNGNTAGIVKNWDRDVWIEYHNNQWFATFDLVGIKDREVILYDSTRKLYVRLTRTALYAGFNIGECYRTSSYLKQSGLTAEWRNSGGTGKVIKRLDSDIWIEYHNGQWFAQFEFIDMDYTAVILYD
ncbi:unnamed protein product [Adineta ricciae]|uniref:Uncharacterized protein n=1 Tax=Adineta ricciae TaxID=249248 RepID=A0A815M1V9_ADIRI|nr:unnamed protein product [Adineta ricciae]